MSNLKLARDVLVRAREALVNDIILTANNGGVGRANSYAPILVNLHQAVGVMDVMIAEDSGEVPVADRMAALRAAKAAKQQTNTDKE